MAKKGIFLVLSHPKSKEEEAAYNRWYDESHTRDTLLLPGFRNARRFKVAKEQLLPGKATDPGFEYLAIYEVDDIAKVPEAHALLPQLAGVSKEFMSPAIDQDRTRAFVFEEIFETDEPTELPEGVEFPAKD